MNQPPRSSRPPDWRRPRGVAAGTWDYVNERLIADHYDAFVADTSLCDLDQQIISEYFPLISDSQIVLDLGCGTGRSAIPLAARGYEVIGIDLSQRMLEKMIDKARCDEMAGRGVTALQANLVELDCLADASADHAICMFSTLGMIQGAKNRRRMLSHVARIVRPGGRLVVHVHHRWSAAQEPGGWRALAGSWWRSLWGADHQFGDAMYSYRGLERMFMHRFSRREIRQLLSQTGWQVDGLLKVSIDGAAIVRGASIAGGFIVIAHR